MSLFKGFMGDFDDDPFFGKNKKNSIKYTIPADTDSEDDDTSHMRIPREKNYRNRNNSPQMNSMQQMSSMMNSMLADPFGMFDGFGGMGRRNRGGHGRDLMPFGFPNMNNIFENFQINTNDPNCHSFSSSTVMTMSSGPDGRPQVYQASQSTRTAPGGIRETKKSVCDSRTGTKKLAIGHHIGDRSHILEREQNIHSGQQEERQEFINLDEEEADDFNREWETRARSGVSSVGYGQPRIRSRRQRDDIPAILDRSNKAKPSSQFESRKGYKTQKRGSRYPSAVKPQNEYRPRARISARRHYPAITASPSSDHKTSEESTSKKHEESSKKPEKGKKRSQEDDDDSEEERVERKSNKHLKSSHKKKNYF